jgi:phytoene dehydrogenase-like protein
MRLLAGKRLSESYARKMERFAYGPGAFKVDWALSEAIPWRARECMRAATVHVGGTMEEIAAGESAPWRGEMAGRPFVLVTQPSLFDATRAPVGKYTAWAYCHVPNGWEGSALEAIEAQVERFAPGFRECVLARHVMGTRALEEWDANLVGGDISGGAMTVGQMVARPTMSLYRTGAKGLYLCSASTPPGGGVHGMCGHLAAMCALKDLG